MSRSDAGRARLPKGVTELRKSRGGRKFRASIRRGKAGEVHLGLYETPWLAAFAYGLAAQAVGRPAPPIEIPREEQPDAFEVRVITDRVRRRLGLDSAPARPRAVAPSVDDLLTLFEVAIVGFWRHQAAADAGDHPEAGLEAAAGRLVEAARLLFWDPGAGHPSPAEVMTELLVRRLDRTFRRADLVREVLDDDGDDPRRLALWLVRPDATTGGRLRGFREEVRDLYLDPPIGGSDDHDGVIPGWAAVLGLAPPFDLDRIRAAYLARSRAAHPDAGGSEAEFVRLRTAYEEALAYREARDG